MRESIYRSTWEELEAKKPVPSRVKQVKVINFSELEDRILSGDKEYINNLIKSLYSGDFYILKKAFDKDFIVDLKNKTFKYYEPIASSFHQMLEGTPDFHRKIDIEIGKKYAIKMCKHSFYFYPWNKDPLNIWEPIYKRWRIIKQLMGLRYNEYEKNTPKDGVIDRIQVVQYPSKIGYLEPHVDPNRNQRLFFSGYMSKQGVDYKGLGFYLIGPGNKIVEVEQLIDIGDVGIGYSTIYHGVAPVNIDRNPNWDDVNDGRWFLSMFSNASDEVKNRVTSGSILEKFAIDDLYPRLS